MNDTTYAVIPILNSIQEKASHSNIPSLEVEVPGSKSITNRALLIAALANGTSTLHGTLFSDDSRHFLNCLIQLGFDISIDENNHTVTIDGKNGSIPKKEASIYVGSAGTAARFLTAMLGLSNGSYYLDSSAQMKKRPMAPLLHSLMDLGASITFYEKEGFFPFSIQTSSLQKNEITVDIEHSSQFLSALLMSGCVNPTGFHIHIKGTHGLSYIKMTMDMMQQFGCQVWNPSTSEYIIAPNQQYHACTYQIEPDVSAACYFYAMAPLLGLTVRVKQIHLNSIQGDIRFLHILEQMGCNLEDTTDGILLSAPSSGTYPGVEVDLSDCSDQTMTLAVLAIFANTPTTIKNIGHIRYQESNRMEAIRVELTKMGISCIEEENNLIIYPGIPKPALIETYDDHRIAMAFSLIGLRSDGIVIQNPACCRKTFETYFNLLDSIIAKFKK